MQLFAVAGVRDYEQTKQATTYYAAPHYITHNPPRRPIHHTPSLFSMLEIKGVFMQQCMYENLTVYFSLILTKRSAIYTCFDQMFLTVISLTNRTIQQGTRMNQ